ncbi:MAG TPA: hypothetical protein VGV06_19875 [Methylomirabilota bacterium]|nr:hypothetical protein [Methylomirabilota bacterium]
MGLRLTDTDATPVPTKRWARVEYERLVDRAVFQPGDYLAGHSSRPILLVADLLL